MAFAPIRYALGCGAYPEKPQGSWYNHGYQMIGMYKKDWEHIGGGFSLQKSMVVTVNNIFTTFQ